MRQRIDLGKLYGAALKQGEGVHYDGVAPCAWPPVCPFTLDELLTERRVVLEARLGAVVEGS